MADLDLSGKAETLAEKMNKLTAKYHSSSVAALLFLPIKTVVILQCVIISKNR